jgi:DNA-binding NarL/FixJ family response regulator
MSDTLSSRERDVLQMLWDGLSNKGIAEALGLSESYVKNVQDRIRLKLQVSTKVQLVRRAIEKGLIRA